MNWRELQALAERFCPIAAGIEQPWKVDGDIKLATIMAATASFDHRAIDGAVGAAFMQSFQTLIEYPMRLIA